MGRIKKLIGKLIFGIRFKLLFTVTTTVLIMELVLGSIFINCINSMMQGVVSEETYKTGERITGFIDVHDFEDFEQYGYMDYSYRKDYERLREIKHMTDANEIYVGFIEDGIVYSIYDTTMDFANISMREKRTPSGRRYFKAYALKNDVEENRKYIDRLKNLLEESHSVQIFNVLDAVLADDPDEQMYYAVKVLYEQQKDSLDGICLVEFSAQTLREYYFTMIALLLIAGIIIFVVFAVLLNRRLKTIVVKPIEHLSRVAGELGQFDENGCVRIYTERLKDKRSEFYALEDTFHQLGDEINSNIHEIKDMAVKTARVFAQLDMAREIQKSNLPSLFPPFPERKEVQVYGMMNPAEEVGGDFFDYFIVDDDLVVFMADVSDKGMPAAMFMMSAITLLRSVFSVAKSPANGLSIVNDALCNSNKETLFVSVWVGILHIPTGEFTMANAGHEKPVLFKNGKGFEYIEDLEQHGIVLGVMPDVMYEEYSVILEKGDCVLNYTDGVMEAHNSNDELYGEIRFLDSLNAQKEKLQEEYGIRALIEAAYKDIKHYENGSPQFDDTALVGVQYIGK